MPSSDDWIKKAEESALLREMVLREYDAVSQRYGDAKVNDPPGKIVPLAAPASLVVPRPESFSLQEIEGFFFKKNVVRKDAEREKQEPFQQVQPKDGAASVVQSAALQFNDANGTGVFLASNGAPESLPDQSGNMRSLLQQNSGSNRPLMV